MSIIEVRDLTKRYGDLVAVDHLSFTVEPGSIVGFLGPNGSGKTTTLSILTGLSSATSGAATINGKRYVDLASPARQVGALLEARATHAGRTARNHLRVLAAAAGIHASRADYVLGMVGLESAADRRVGGFSLGMHQRLGLAAALLGDPPVLVLDEPANGLDPDGIRWMRQMLVHLRSQGRAVLVSSHVLNEVEQIADRVVIIAQGRLVADSAVAELRAAAGHRTVVGTADPSRFAGCLRQAGAQVETDGLELVVTGMPRAQIGEIAAAHAIPLTHMHDVTPDLESLFLQLTASEGAIR